MNLAEKIVRAYQNNEPMPLKGHTKITLTDVNTGEKQVIEKDNMVTNAVADLLAKNWCGLANFSTLLPLKNLFSGVLCFEGELTEDADEYFPPNDGDCEQVCHAGDEAHTTADVTRGQPNIGEQVVTDTSIKQVWDFGTSVQGEIRTVCLVPGTFGNMGTKPYNTTYNPLSSFGDDRAVDTSWSETRSKNYPIRISNDGKYGYSLYLDGATFKERKMRHDYFAFGIMRSSSDWVEDTTRTATVRTGDNRFMFEDDTYYYVARVTGSTTLQVDKIAKTDMTVTTADCTFTGLTLWTGAIGNYFNGTITPFAFDGTYLYFPNGDGNKFCKLNLSNNSDVTLIPETLSISMGELTDFCNNGEQFMSPIVINDGLILGDNYVINDVHAYQIAQTKQIGCRDYYVGKRNWLQTVKFGSAVYGNGFSSQDGFPTGQSCVLNKMVLTTINVLDSAVNKTSSVTMKIEYTLTEV